MFIDLKGYKLPDELRPEIIGGNIIPPNYYWISINETSRYVFILYSTYDKPPGANDLVKGYIYYDKYEDHEYALPNDRSRFGFINDLDGGPEFIPEYTSDSVAYCFIYAEDFKEYLVSDNFYNALSIKYNSNENRLEEIKKIDLYDNPILIVATLK